MKFNLLEKLTFRAASLLPALGSLLAGPLAAQSAPFPTPPFLQAENHPGNPWYPGNRAPLQPSPLIKLPVSAITPQGWLRRQLELDASGMCGNLKELSDFIKDGCAWASPTGEGHNGWEEPMYWLRGYGDLAYTLKHPEMIQTTKTWVDAMIASRQPNGYFGPKSLLTRTDGHPECWPHYLAINVLRSHYEFSNNPAIIPLLTGYFKWVNTLSDKDFSRSGLDSIRAVEQITNLHWLYNQTGEQGLLDLAARIHANTADWINGRPTPHNVDIAMGFRQPAVFWQQSGNPLHRHATHTRYHEVMAEFGQFPGGGFAGDENISGNFDPRQGFETCGFSEFMHSFQTLTRIEANPVWADRCEEIAFNSYPAALTPDHKGLHYVTCANMVSNDFRERRVTFTNGWVKTGYSATVDYRCCQHNHGITWPFYAQNLWLATADRGLCKSLYAASSVTAKVGDGTPVTIHEKTEYPFSETITLRLDMPNPVAFPLYLRIPGWCTNPTLTLNGSTHPTHHQKSGYARIHRTWQPGDALTLTLPMQLHTKTWQKNHNSQSVAFGPLWFSLKIGEQWTQIDRGIPNWPGWEVSPTTPWNYGLVIDPKQPAAASLELVRKPGPVPDEPFTHDTTPLAIRAKARRIPQWKTGLEKWITPLQPSPVLSTEPLESVTLIPMGAARLRITAFPTVTDSPDGHRWTETKLPLAASFKVTTSHGKDLLDLANDGVSPDRSDDAWFPRITWWDHTGTREWLQYTFPEPLTVSSCAVFWFDDSPRGRCKTPASWRITYQKDGNWIPVDPTDGPWQALEGKQEYKAEKDKFNTIRFKPVITGALRLEVQLADGHSAGLFEWRVND